MKFVHFRFSQIAESRLKERNLLFKIIQEKTLGGMKRSRDLDAVHVQAEMLPEFLHPGKNKAVILRPLHIPMRH